jgi:hypothetical protein
MKINRVYAQWFGTLVQYVGTLVSNFHAQYSKITKCNSEYSQQNRDLTLRQIKQE